MNKKERFFYAVIGGCVGAVLVMAAGWIAPLGAQDEVKDAEFGKTTCRGLDVVDEHGETMASMRIGEHGGKFWVFGKDEKDSKMTGFNMAGMGIDKDGGVVHGLRKRVRQDSGHGH